MIEREEPDQVEQPQPEAEQPAPAAEPETAQPEAAAAASPNPSPKRAAATRGRGAGARRHAGGAARARGRGRDCARGPAAEAEPAPEAAPRPRPQPRPTGRGRGRAGDPGGAEPAEQEQPRTLADLAAGARYFATGKRKMLCGAGDHPARAAASSTSTAASLEEYFPRPTHQAVVRQPLEVAGYGDRIDVRARIHGGGISGQADAVRHGIAKALIEADPALRRRAEAPAAPDARPAREGAPQGRPQEGA